MRGALIIIGAGATLLGVAAGAFTARAVGNSDPVHFAIERRLMVLDEQTRRASPQPEIMVIGDSITERSGLTRLCGRPAFNAGVSSATAEEVAAHAPGWIAAQHPVAAIVALGMNDARRSATNAPESYEAALRAIAASGVPVGFVAITPLEAGKATAASFSQARIDALNARLAALAETLHAPLAPRIAVPTLDGVHPDDGGDRLWRANLERACPAALVSASDRPAGSLRRL